MDGRFNALRRPVAPIAEPTLCSYGLVADDNRPPDACGASPGGWPSHWPTMIATSRMRHVEAGSVALWLMLIARTTLRTRTRNHGGGKLVVTVEGGVAEGVAMVGLVSESHAGPNQTAVVTRWSSTLRRRSELSLICP